MRVWRLARRPHQALDGDGARLYGGRWNSEGRPVVYASASLSLAALELLVHVEPLQAPRDLVAIEIDVPDDAALGAIVPLDQLPTDWRDHPPPLWVPELADVWIADGELLWLAVPSAIVPSEVNVLLNPRHARMREVHVVSTAPFTFDERLV